MKRITEKKEGDSISASDWNAMVRELDRLGRLSVSGNLELIDGPGGMVIYDGQPDLYSWVRPVSACTGGGKYLGKLCRQPERSIDQTADLAYLDLTAETDFASTDCVILNPSEATLTTHDLDVTNKGFFLARNSGLFETASGYPVYILVSDLEWEVC